MFLPFGLRTAPLIFNLFNEIIHWIMQLKGYNLCHYIDDFLLILSPESLMIHTVVNDFSEVCDIMGFMIEQRKNKEGTLIDFLDLEIDTMTMKTHLPPDKHQRALFIIIDILQRKFISFHILEKLLDFLSFYCAVISLGQILSQTNFQSTQSENASSRTYSDKQSCQTRSPLMDSTSPSMEQHGNHTLPFTSCYHNLHRCKWNKEYR